MADTSGLKVILPDAINGHRKTGKGIYVPTDETLRATLAGCVPALDSLRARYVPQGDEMAKLLVAWKTGQAALISGPTGIGKSLLVRDFAAAQGLPLLVYTANADATDYKMRGSVDAGLFPMMDEAGRIHEIKLKTFSPNQIALAAMARQPVVLFIDELHKIREGVTSLVHSLVNATERTLYCYELTGENYTMHPASFIVAALNPSYGDGGIDRLDAALRRRWATIPLDMPSKDTVVKIVAANVGELDGRKAALVEKLAFIQASLHSALRNSESGQSQAATTAIGANELNTETLSSIIEVPSPSSIVETMRSINAGLPVMAAIEMNMIDPVLTDFGPARAALRTYFGDKIPAELRA